MSDCSFSYQNDECTRPSGHMPPHLVDGEPILENILQPFDEWADDYDLTDSERSAAFGRYMETMTGDIFDLEES